MQILTLHCEIASEMIIEKFFYLFFVGLVDNFDGLDDHPNNG